MIKSMTGFGRGENAAGEKRYIAEVKTINNRYRDVIVRTPKSLQGVEDEVRALVSERIKRGRVEATLQLIREGEAPEYDLELNLPLVHAYMRIFRRLNEEFGLDDRIRVDSFAQMKDLILLKPEEVDLEEAKTGFRAAVQIALEACDRMRSREGEAIEEDFRKRLDLIRETIREIETRSPLVVQEYQKRLRQRIEQMLQGVEVDEGRLAQEVALFADRADITEEVVRARSHLDQFRAIMSQEDAVGRKLEFLLQELHREINTISAKSSDAAMSSRTVDLKAELEKLREQVQNIE